jgi:hypothetical protein
LIPKHVLDMAVRAPEENVLLVVWIVICIRHDPGGRPQCVSEALLVLTNPCQCTCFGKCTTGCSDCTP